MKNKTKILFLVQFPPPVHGSSLIGERIAGSEIVNETFECSFMDISTSRSMKNIGKLRPSNIFIFIKIYIVLFIKLAVGKYDHVLFAVTASGLAFYRDIFIISILKLFNLRYTLLMNNKGVLTNSDSSFKRKLYHYLFKDSSVIQNSKYLYNDISNYIELKNVHVLFNGIPEPDTSPLNSESTIFEEETINLLYLANMTCSKGVYVLIDACKILKDREIIFHCNFVGAWNDISRSEFEYYLNNNNLSNEISYKGVKYNDEKYNEYSHSDIFVFPTFYNYECFPLVLLEAMQHSLPVVSTFEGGIPDIVDDGVTGFLVQQKDAEALADKLEILINNPELRKKMGEAGRRKYEEQFTLDKFENRLVEILEDILEKQKK
jgi:glycosyltransferase involved in cell wall biosynthesis